MASEGMLETTREMGSTTFMPPSLAFFNLAQILFFFSIRSELRKRKKKRKWDETNERDAIGNHPTKFDHVRLEHEIHGDLTTTTSNKLLGKVLQLDRVPGLTDKKDSGDHLLAQTLVAMFGQDRLKDVLEPDDVYYTLGKSC